MKVQLVNISGSDWLIARVARLSRGLAWDNEVTNDKEDAFVRYLDPASDLAETEEAERVIRDETTQLLRSLFTEKRLTPFEFADATFYIEAPIYIARELMRYRCASYLERVLRSKTVDDKRNGLPLSTPTAFYMRANLREWFHIMDERLTTLPQGETRALVGLIHRELLDAFPISISLWNETEPGKKYSDICTLLEDE